MQKLREEELTTEQINQNCENEVPKSEILLKKISTGKFVSGAFLEAAIRWNDCYLLFMTDDVPFEEMLGIHLFDKKLNLLDSATLGAMYSTGSFSSLELVEPNIVGFRFFGDTDWTVELLTKPIFRVPYFSDSRGVWRKFGFTRHFKIHGHPLPEVES